MERKSGYRKSFSKPQMKQQMFNYSKIYIKLVMLSLGLHPDLYTIILIKAPERMGSNIDHSLFWVFSELPISISPSVCNGVGIRNGIWGLVICHEIIKLSFLIFFSNESYCNYKLKFYCFNHSNREIVLKHLSR